ncbi:TetR/AcrR family transcriptional regulator [Tomitella cavernea]|uniref:HTH tetR-type domain-containing protein n=1 Tax=Tomitella cavernea TaxID=1387982 RepID=A0ABP9CIT7_9ACTN|nr:TetR family transcriptional regulator [Tomitella cavernea]
MTLTSATARRESPARAAMIDAAERIVAERGLTALTLRAVQEAAGQSNKSAANYHFGSRDGLVGAVLAERMDPIAAHRRAMLDTLDAAPPTGPEAPLRALAEAFVVPLARRVLLAPGSAYARFLAQSLVSPELAGLIAEHSTLFTVEETRRRMVAVLTAPGARHGLDEETACWRTAGLLGYVVGALAAAEAATDGAGHSPAFPFPPRPFPPPPFSVPGAALSPGRVTARLVDTCHGLLTAPAGPDALDLHSTVPQSTSPIREDHP